MNNKTLAICAAIIYLLGVTTGWFLFHDRKVVQEAAAPAVQLAPSKSAPHGGVVVARMPDAPAKSAQVLPKGYKAVRVQQVTIQPEAAQKAADMAAAPNCPPAKPVTVDLTQIQTSDGGQRLAVSSPDGTVIGGFDVPIGSQSVVFAHRWAAGASYGTDRTYGGWVERDIGRLRLGVDVLQLQDGRVGARARIGLAFGG